MRFRWWQLWALVLSLLMAWFLLRALRPWSIHIDDGQAKEPVTVLLPGAF